MLTIVDHRHYHRHRIWMMRDAQMRSRGGRWARNLLRLQQRIWQHKMPKHRSEADPGRSNNNVAIQLMRQQQHWQKRWPRQCHHMRGWCPTTIVIISNNSEGITRDFHRSFILFYWSQRQSLFWFFRWCHFRLPCLVDRHKTLVGVFNLKSNIQ